LLFSIHSAGHLFALAKHDPAPGPFPEDLPAIEAELDRIRASVPRSPAPGAHLAREGRLLLVKGERLRDRAPEEAERAWTRAVESFQASLEAHPLDAPTHREMALALERLGREKEADFYVERGAQLSPSHADLQYKLGLFYFERRAIRKTNGGWTVDRDALRKAFACFRNAAQADLSCFDRALSLVEKSLPALEDFSALLPPTLEARVRYARFLARRGRWSEVAVIEEEAIANGLDDAQTRIRAGEARLLEGESEQADSHFRAAFDRWSLSPSQVRRIRAFFEKGSRESSGIEFFLSLEALQPEEEIPVAKALGALYFRIHRYRDADEYYRRAAVEASDSEAYYALGILSEMAGDLYGAERNLKQAIRGHRDEPRFHHKLGQVLERGGNIAEALREFETASRMAPKNPAWRRDLERIEKRWRKGE